MTCSYFYFTTHFSLLTFERKLLLSTDDLCTLNSVLILTYPFASQFAAYLNRRPECFVCQKGIFGLRNLYFMETRSTSRKHQWFRRILLLDTAEKKCLE